ncbi:MAG TPA: hypothetical protein K8V05_07730 [Butyricimonas virosa]|uniref:Uncharacterized protein n=1 Tax=Butyricimonas virosa TaxID=544645 RepID=A0A921H6J5_9BACT|nr:hypothetical protein [Butyricimonas virosa]
MKKFWMHNLSITLSLLVVFLVTLYSIGIHDNHFGHYLALAISGISGLQSIASLIIGLYNIKLQTANMVLLGILSVAFSSLITIYTFNGLFISC